MRSYPDIYPRLPIEAFLFFTERPEGEKWLPKTVVEFCEYYKTKYETEDLPQPRVVAMICERFVDSGYLSLHSRAGMDSMQNRYFGILKDNSLRNNEHALDYLNLHLGFVAFGFPYIYRYYQPLVLPLFFEDANGDKSLGTCFRYQGGIVSAKHCFEGAHKIAIQGIQKDYLRGADFIVHENSLMDIIFVEVPGLEHLPPFAGKAEILDEVMTLGYPRVPGYHNFLATETATVSSRFTATVGAVAASAEDIWICENLLLITAKIHGGNSGGPVINNKGQIIGVSVNMADGNGNYDSLGYGTVIPLSFLDKDILEGEASIVFDASGIEFVDFE